MNILLKKGGFYTTVQDLGRVGYRTYGVPAAGVMDSKAARIANKLVGNSEKEAVLETALLGPEIHFGGATTFAVTGGNSVPKLNGEEIALYSEVQAKEGDVLTFSFIKEGCRGYIAFHGGLAVREIMGSKSTLVKSQLGGIGGAKISDGTVIELNGGEFRTDLCRKTAQPEYQGKEVTIRVILGPEEEYFTESGIDTFLNTPYKIGFSSDRMAYRLSGKAIEHRTTEQIISNGLAFGSIEVPPDGQPLIMMADGPTTGGYTKIATVISVDLSVLAQCQPGTVLHFVKTDIKEAQEIYLKQEKELAEILN